MENDRNITRTSLDLPRHVNAALYLRAKKEGQTKAALIRSILVRELQDELIEIRKEIISKVK